jgi:hypothetical protein
MPNRKKKSKLSEKEVEVCVMGGRQLPPGSVVEKSLPRFTLISMGMPTTLAFGWKKFYVRSWVRSDLRVMGAGKDGRRI